MAAFFSARSTSGLSSVGGLERAAGCTSHPVSAAQAPLRQDDDESLSAGRSAGAENASAKVRTDSRRLAPEKPVSPVYAGHSIKPESQILEVPGTCSLGQDASLKSERSLPRSVVRIRCGLQIRNEVLTARFSVKRTKACRQRGRHRSEERRVGKEC